MRPILFNLGPIPIRLYGLMIATGFLVSLYFILRDARKTGIDTKVYENAAFYTLPLGILGTRIAHIMLFPSSYSITDPIGWIAVWRGGLVFQGGPPLVLVFMLFYLPRHGVGVLQTADIVFPYLPLAHGFGRLGCFFNGCCYGIPTDLPWGIAFPSHAVGLDLYAEPVHPTQLYSMAGLLSICGLLLYLRKHWHPFEGFVMPAYFVLYGVFRFFLEFLRGDHNPVHIGGLSDQQLFALAFTAAGISLFVFLQKRPAPQPS